MAEADSWKSIKQHGLCSTTALLDLFEITGPERDPIESARRPEAVRIEHPDNGAAWIRDNKPINETVLRRTLVGMSEAEWYRTLNGRVFFWLSEDRLDRLRTAAPYRDHKHDLSMFDTESLLVEYGETVELSAINSGAVHPGAEITRGVGTFSPIDTYPWRERVRKARREPIVELTMQCRLADPDRFLIDYSTV